MLINANRKRGLSQAQRLRAESLKRLGFRPWALLHLPAGLHANADDLVMYQSYGNLQQWIVISRNGLVKQRKTL